MTIRKHVAWHENPYFLQHDHYTTTTQWVNPGNAALVLEDGEYILKAGTIWPSNDENAQGIVLRDVVVPPAIGAVTDGCGATFAMITHARINPQFLPQAPTSDAIAALKNITFSDPSMSNPAIPAGYFQIKNKSAAATASAGTFAAGATISSSVVVNAISPAVFASTLDVLDFQISDYKYPVYVSAVSNSSGDVTVTIKARKAFHCHAGEEITLCVQPGAFSAGVDFPTNTITVLKFV